MAEQNGFAPEYLETLTRLLEQNDEIAKHTQELPRIAEELKQLRIELVSVLTNRTPDGSISFTTHKELMAAQSENHKELMKTLNRTWAILVAVALGIVKMGPAAEKLIGRLAT